MVDTVHRIVIVGGGSAGITVAARLRRKGQQDIAVIEPAATHYYQPLWTLVGGGRAPIEVSARPQSRVMPKGVTWIRQAAVGVDPETRTVALGDGSTVEYDKLVMCPGIQLDWEKITGLRQTLGRDGVSGNYLYELAPATWRFIRELRSGTTPPTRPAMSRSTNTASDTSATPMCSPSVTLARPRTPRPLRRSANKPRARGEPARGHGGPSALGLLQRIRLVPAHPLPAHPATRRGVPPTFRTPDPIRSDPEWR